MADQFVFIWDSKTGYFRSDIYPKYKVDENAEPISEEDKQLNNIAFPQFDLLYNRILPDLGFANSFRFDKYEADDGIAHIAYKIRHNCEITIISRDNDLFQLLHKNVKLYDPVKRGFITEKTFKDKWEIEPTEWGIVKSIAGCTSDKVPGIEGVKEINAIKFLKAKLKHSSKAYKNIMAGAEAIMRNAELVVLPHSSFSYEVFLVNDFITTDKFEQVCNKYGMKSLLTRQNIDNFVDLFSRGNSIW
jgi:DNA polymerase-1